MHKGQDQVNFVEVYCNGNKNGPQSWLKLTILEQI